MKSRLKLAFKDFWPGFELEKFRLFQVLEQHFPVEISDDPDFLFFSDYSNDHLQDDCVKIHFSGENTRPNFNIADFFIGFEYSPDPRVLRYPLYVEYRDDSYNEEFLERPLTDSEAREIVQSKTKFCCFIVSNGKCRFRNEFFEKLNRRRPVDSGGGYLNNLGFRVENKIEFMKDYKFIIAFENISYPGYTTEKVLQPFYSRTVPIYWGSPKVDDEFNPNSFVWVRSPEECDAAIDRVLALADDDEAYQAMLQQSPYYERRRSHYYSEERIVAFFERVFESSQTGVTPLARQLAQQRASLANATARASHRLKRLTGLR